LQQPPEGEFLPKRSHSWRRRVTPACAGVQGHRNKRRTAEEHVDADKQSERPCRGARKPSKDHRCQYQVNNATR
jgi:hypothetical protein